MTVAELQSILRQFPPDCMVYVPSEEGKCDLAKGVCPLQHEDLPEGVSIPNDVFIIPWLDDELQAKMEAQRADG